MASGSFRIHRQSRSGRLLFRRRAFLHARDSFYLATVTETGWPYVQHRGGPRGFLRVLDDHTLGFADYGGNRQMLSTGNLASDIQRTLAGKTTTILSCPVLVVEDVTRG